MAVFRVERNRGYTVMSNHHLRNKELSLKAKGLLSQMLSLPENWDYTLAGLALINKESIDAIRTAVWELEKAGYITRRQGRDERGKMTAIEYTIYEQPQPPELDSPILENPTSANPSLDFPTTGKPTTENPMQLNKDISRTDLPKKEKPITDLSSTDSIPILSPDLVGTSSVSLASPQAGKLTHSAAPPLPTAPAPLGCGGVPKGGGAAATPPERKRKEAATQSAVEIYREIIAENISYDILITDSHIDRDRLDELMDIMLETICTARTTVRIAGDDYPAELVRAKFMKLDSEHIRFVLDCMQENTTKIRNMKQYLRTVLFNAPSTINNYYTSLVAHDMATGQI